MKFKIGDKVRILPSAVDGGVSEYSVGKIGQIINYHKEYRYFLVRMDSQEVVQPQQGWAIFPNQIEQIYRIGQQLLFDFMTP